MFKYRFSIYLSILFQFLSDLRPRLVQLYIMNYSWLATYPLRIKNKTKWWPCWCQIQSWNCCKSRIGYWPCISVTRVFHPWLAQLNILLESRHSSRHTITVYYNTRSLFCDTRWTIHTNMLLLIMLMSAIFLDCSIMHVLDFLTDHLYLNINHNTNNHSTIPQSKYIQSSDFWLI